MTHAHKHTLTQQKTKYKVICSVPVTIYIGRVVASLINTFIIVLCGIAINGLSTRYPIKKLNQIMENAENNEKKREMVEKRLELQKIHSDTGIGINMMNRGSSKNVLLAQISTNTTNSFEQTTQQASTVSSNTTNNSTNTNAHINNNNIAGNHKTTIIQPMPISSNNNNTTMYRKLSMQQNSHNSEDSTNNNSGYPMQALTLANNQSSKGYQSSNNSIAKSKPTPPIVPLR